VCPAPLNTHAILPELGSHTPVHHLGFSRHVAERLVAQTVRGSVDYFKNREDPVHLARLRNQVTSAGGTTAAALYYLEKAGFRTAISRAIWAAYERSQELGADAKPHSPE